MAERPLILLSNDDGVHAEGLHALRSSLREIAEVFVVAPAREQSAMSHRITLAEPLRHSDLGHDTHMVDGSPADCIYVALNLGGLLPRRPDLVVSGINHGFNLGTDVVYSGTVAAAREGALRGIPAMAVSADARADYALVAREVLPLVERLLGAETKSPPLLNVNFPSQKPLGVRATCLGKRDYEDRVEAREDPRGRTYYWIGGPAVPHDDTDGTDTGAIAAGFASVTPLSLEMTAHAERPLAEWVASGTWATRPAS